MRYMGEPHTMYVRPCPACMGCKAWQDVIKEGDTYRVQPVPCEYCAGQGYLPIDYEPPTGRDTRPHRACAMQCTVEQPTDAAFILATGVLCLIILYCLLHIAGAM